MKKKETLANRLIKKNQLIKFLKEKGILRTSPEALEEIQKNLKQYLTELAENGKENMITHGRATLKKEDLETPNSKMEKSWEI